MSRMSFRSKARDFVHRLTRRDFFKGTGVAAAAGMLGAGESAAEPCMRIPVTTYESIGVEPVINCWGTMTILGGSLMPPEVMAAMEEANKAFVYMPELIEGAGRRLAELTGAEWGCVTAGATSAIYAATAACVCGGDTEKMAKIPDTTGMKNEAVVPKAHFTEYVDVAARMVGLKLIQVDSKSELEAAINEKTAIVYILGEVSRPGYPTRGNLSYEDIVSVAGKHGVPTLVDAAAEEPNVPIFYLETGADLVCYSGGKCLRGPQSAGILLGRKDLCSAAAKNLSPYRGLGRAQKVGKEEIMGVLAALELWLHGRDHEAEYEEWKRMLKYISDRITKVPTVRTKMIEPGRPSNVAPTMSIDWDRRKVKLTHEEFRDRLFNGGYPRIRIATYTGDASHTRISSIMPYQMRRGDEIPVARRMYEILSGSV